MKSYPISSPRSIIIGGDFNANTKMRNKDHLLNNIVGSYAKSDINDNGEKYKNVVDSKTKQPRRNPYRN